MQYTKDLDCLSGGNINENNRELRFHAWRPGPYARSFKDMLELGHTGRNHDISSEIPCTHHMGFGAAIHMSSIAEPIAYLLKRFGVIEQSYHDAISESFIQAGIQKRITPELLARELIFPWCESNPPRHYSQLTKESREIVWSSIPWIVRYNPWSFPFMLPAPVIDDLQKDLHSLIEHKSTNGISEEDILAYQTILKNAKIQNQSYGNVVQSETAGLAFACGLPEWQQTCKNRGGMHRN